MLLRTITFSTLLASAGDHADSTLRARVETVLERRAPSIIALRRDLHRNAELSGKERMTSATVATRLRQLGLEVRTGVGGYGVVGILTGRHAGPTVAYRADMDAFPSDASDAVPFASRTRGVRHICGHDLHTAIGVALAEALAAVRNDLHGRVIFVFQPAEETATGAKAMLAAGVFERIRPDAIYALHTAPLPVGMLGTTSGALMPGRDRISVSITGRGDVASVASATQQFLERLGTLTASQSVAPAAPDFVFAEIGAPERISDTAWVVRGTFTIADDSVRARTRARVVSELAQQRQANVTVSPTYTPRVIAGVTNNAPLTTRASAAMRAALGAERVIDITQIFPAFSEDFGAFQERVPGVYYFLGVANAAKGYAGMPHAPDYVADEGAMLVGARAMAAVILDRLATP
jgi:amidohydrolase